MRARRGWVSRVSLLARKQNAHSYYLAFGALLLSMTLIVDLVFHLHMRNQWLLWSLLAFALLGSVIVFSFGARLPHWVGITAVLVFGASQTYFLSLRDDPQAVVSSVQQLPVVALYLGWFVRPRIAHWLNSMCVCAFGIAMYANPLFGVDGDIGLPVAVHGILSVFFCFFVGTYLWLHTTRQATIDPLTGAVNRNELIARVELQLRRNRSRRVCALAAIDFDDFKRLNDDFGHAEGDRALRDTVAEWRFGTRAQDVVARIGGDEFVIFLPGSTAADAELLLERLQADGVHRWSFGIAESTPSDTVSMLMSRADEALYQQKRLKRERARG